MSDNLKTSVATIFSENSDYSDPEFITNLEDFILTPDEVQFFKIEAPTGGGTTLTTSFLGAASLLVVQNVDASNFVTVTFRSAGNGATNNIIRIAAGGFLMTTDFTVANNLVLAADTAAVNCKVIIAGT